MSEKIFKFFGWCYHRHVGDGLEHCTCGWEPKPTRLQYDVMKHAKNLNPDFTTYDGMGMLLEGLREKTCLVQIDNQYGYTCHLTWKDSEFRAIGDTLPLAVLNAAEKMVDSE